MSEIKGRTKVNFLSQWLCTLTPASIGVPVLPLSVGLAMVITFAPRDLSFKFDSESTNWFKIPHIASNLDLSYSSAGSCIPGPESWALFNSVMGRAWAWWCYSKSRRVTVTVIAPRFQGFHHQQGGECIFFIFLAWSAYFVYFAYFLAYFPW